MYQNYFTGYASTPSNYKASKIQREYEKFLGNELLDSVASSLYLFGMSNTLEQQ